MSVLKSKIPPLSLMILLLAMALVVISYIVIYQLAPLPEPWSDLYLVYSIVVAAFAAAALSTRVWLSFRVQDAPRLVWKYFSLGWWMWALAELVWGIYYLFDPEVPDISLADPLWIVGLVFFGLAFIYQFRLVVSPSRQTEKGWILVAAVITLGLSLAGTWLLIHFGPDSELGWAEAFMSIFYAATDLVMMAAALKLARIFGRGLWGQAWLGLLAFVISDTLYSWSVFSGAYAYSVSSGNLLTLVVDVLYLLAYLLIALACHMQYLLVRFGPTLRPPVDIEGPA